MNRILQYKITVGILSAVMLMIAFFMGLAFWALSLEIGYVLSLILISILIVVNFYIIEFINVDKKEPSLKYRLIISVYLALNLIFAYFIGFTIPLLQTDHPGNFGGVMIPLLLILNFIIVDRYHYLIRHANDREVGEDGE
ncbi:MAG: hypothetical protein EU535_08140 [Promethearchaeota archaeon]|nr:MAG: hypothetical protein EU535_08140 [Candidatus Lokiarchaeota archaeon]